jgi:enediyne biosynthesis protein E4
LFKNDTLNGISWNGREHNRLFWNDGNSGFTDVAFGLGVDATEDGRSTIFFDADGDGDLDLLVANMNDEHPIRLFRNNHGNERNWLEVEAKGTASNSQAVGALIRVFAGDKTWVRPVVAGQGYETSYYGPLHFGLGDHSKVDRVEVAFQDGAVVTLKDVSSRQVLVVCEDGKATCATAATPGQATAVPTLVSKLEK